MYVITNSVDFKSVFSIHLNVEKINLKKKFFLVKKTHFYQKHKFLKNGILTDYRFTEKETILWKTDS